MRSIHHRGLEYDARHPFDKNEGRGVLAEGCYLAGQYFPSGTLVARDIDWDYVIATITGPLDVRGNLLPEGAQLHLYKAKPRSIGGHVFHALWTVPVLSVWLATVGTIEFFSGKWRPGATQDFQERSEVWATIYLPDRPEKPAHILVDGTLEEPP